MKTIEAQSDLPINEALQVSPKTPMEMLAVAVTRGATIDELAKLMDLQERWEKNKTVTYGSGDRATSYSHATLDHVCEAVTKGLSEHGISHRWKVDQDKDS